MSDDANEPAGSLTAGIQQLRQIPTHANDRPASRILHFALNTMFLTPTIKCERHKLNRSQNI